MRRKIAANVVTPPLDPLHEEAGRLEALASARQSAREREVDEVKAGLAPTLKRAAELREELDAIARTHGDYLRRLHALDAHKLLAFAPTDVVTQLARYVTEAVDGSDGFRKNIDFVESRARDLNPASSLAHMESWIRATVKGTDDGPAYIRSRIAKVRELVAKIESHAVRAEGRVVEFLGQPVEPRSQTHVESAYDPFVDKETL